MMLSVLVWLAMQLPYNSVDCDPQMRNGKEYQQCAVDAPAEQTPDLSQLTDPGIVQHRPWDNPVYNEPGIVQVAPNLPPPDSHGWTYIAPIETAPAEHVIEIKTVREDHGTAKDSRTQGLGGSPYCDNPDDTLEYPNQCYENACTSMYIAPHCVKLTRELWIDGQKFGVIKGLD